jgi:hypothetical protein
MKMANELMGAVGQAGGHTPVPGAPPPPPQIPEWHMAESGQSVGPMTMPQLAQAVVAGRLRPETLVWKAGMANWAIARDTPELAPLFGAIPPPVPRT